jgi:hypothetical protein
MARDDDLRAQLDQWWQRRSPEERNALIKRRHAEFGPDDRQMVMDANERHPFKPDQPPTVAITTDNRNPGRFRLPSILVEYLEIKAKLQRNREA